MMYNVFWTLVYIFTISAVLGHNFMIFVHVDSQWVLECFRRFHTKCSASLYFYNLSVYRLRSVLKHFRRFHTKCKVGSDFHDLGQCDLGNVMERCRCFHTKGSVISNCITLGLFITHKWGCAVLYPPGQRLQPWVWKGPSWCPLGRREGCPCRHTGSVRCASP